jgi:hypothetical protein
MATKNAVGSLAVQISANAATFDQEMTRVAAEVNSLHRRIKPPKPIDLGDFGAGAVGRAGGFAGTVAGLAGVGGRRGDGCQGVVHH